MDVITTNSAILEIYFPSPPLSLSRKKWREFFFSQNRCYRPRAILRRFLRNARKFSCSISRRNRAKARGSRVIAVQCSPFPCIWPVSGQSTLNCRCERALAFSEIIGYKRYVIELWWMDICPAYNPRSMNPGIAWRI